MIDYDEEGCEIEQDHEGDRADGLYDEMRDDFLMINSEKDARDCIERYPRMAHYYLPNKYTHLLKEKKQ